MSHFLIQVSLLFNLCFVCYLHPHSVSSSILHNPRHNERRNGPLPLLSKLIMNSRSNQIAPFLPSLKWEKWEGGGCGGEWIFVRIDQHWIKRNETPFPQINYEFLLKPKTRLFFRHWNGKGTKRRGGEGGGGFIIPYLDWLRLLPFFRVFLICLRP